MLNLVFLIPLLPLIGFVLLGVFGSKLPKFVSGAIACTTVLVSFLITLTLLGGVLSGSIVSETITYFDWINTDGIYLPMSFLIDPLSVWMMTIITGVGFLIHLYSAGYMSHDEGFARYFTFLNLFVFSMLMLVMGSNFVVMFAGWEGVGFCSYMLIGFWFKNTNYNNAAKKAFIMNRVGDLGFLIGMLLIFVKVGSLEYATVFGQAPLVFESGTTDIVVITLCLFVGAMGKSAQIPLYTWLPDAMAGPTPVSALIHAATMVTAGIYMIVRSNVLYTLAPFTQDFIMIIGLCTALFAATIGLVQNDIKKVLAYSTVSQLGYMFFALGLGAYTTGLFHVTTHAFFKALLFLGSGSVIHAMSGEQDIRSMGGLRKKLPITFLTFLIGTIAIAGIPPFAGFFSKDEILAYAYQRSPILWALGILGALMTTFYMFRMFFLTFFGEFRGTEHQRSHLHESPLIMTLPLMILSILSIAGGFLGVPHVLGGHNWFGHYLSGVAPVKELALDHSTEILLMSISVALVLVVIIIAYVIYVSKKQVPVSEGSTLTTPHRVLYNKYYIDELYDALFSKTLRWKSEWFYKLLEKGGIDSLVNGIGKGVQWSGKTLRMAQTGNISTYLFLMVLGIILLLIITGLLV
ncbi:MAG: NADH-quinone oxidoreductase subunit L [Cytophagaceae bacterium]|jgi:NADH-quinone oxidoreductase subunit L|nr:NADH-quinone oxidoreductase subunit L [Cytophagaceae bacterium]